MSMVEWKKLGEVCEVLNGFAFKSQEYVPEGIRIIRISDVQSGYLSDKDMVYYPIDKLPEYKRFLLSEGDIVMSLTGNPGRIAIIPNNRCALNQRVACLRPKSVNKSYIYYLFNCKEFETIAFANSTGGAQKNLSTVWLKSYPIPLPSLSEQERIVGILDTFTSSIENLKAQISLRRKQYEHYRDKLLDLEEKPGVEMKTLGEICEVINGRAYSQPELLSEGKYRVLRVGNFFSNDSWYYSNLELEDKYYCNKGDLLYAWSASFGPHIWEEEKTIYHYHIWKMNCSNKIYMKYMYYWLQSEDMKGKAFGRLHGATMAHLTKALMESLQVPLPSLEEQSRIVSILDEFEASIKNLEAQLEARQKQYEYYRNKLLTFN